MRHALLAIGSAAVASFALGIAVSPFALHAISDAHAAAAPLTPMMIDLASLKHDELPKTANPEMNNRGLVVTDNATIARRERPTVERW